ncbi:MAG: alpha/beta hydrolase [Mesorhizobium sp.]|nr:alpha/beta hydrolase [Mesorhizobium sp.]
MDVDFFTHEGFRLAFLDAMPASGSGEPVLLIHGFASSMQVNWIGPGWVGELTRAGYRVIAFDHRGHGASTKSLVPSDYTPSKMAGDAAALLDHLGIALAHVMGYSMGARVAAFTALEHRDKVAALVLGGLGIGMIDGVGDWDIISDALLADDAASVTDKRGRMFRAFADSTKSDRHALAACIAMSRQLLTVEEAARIVQPTLVAVGTKDDIAGAPGPLAALLPDAQAFDIENRDHMLSVGDRTFKKKVLEFLSAHPL